MASKRMVSLYSDVNFAQTEALVAEATKTRAMLRVQASTRPDYGGTPATMLLTPFTYQEKVLRLWEFYHTDPFFHRLIDRTIDFVANGSAWMVPIPAVGSWLEKLRTWGRGKEKDVERQEDFWNQWHATVNDDLPNMIPGMDQVIRWATKHMLLSGMFVPHWEYGEVKFGKQSFTMPTRMTCYPASLVTLMRENNSFAQEKLFITKGGLDIMQENYMLQAPQYSTSKLQNQIELPILDVASPTKRTDEAFALKYNWTPGDLSTVRYGARNITGTAVYPGVPFYSLIPQFVVRQKLFAADAAILDGVMNYIMLWSIGDKDNPPQPPKINAAGTVTQPSTIASFMNAVRSQNRAGPAAELFVPHWAKLNIIMPDGALLLSEEKYYASAIEIMTAFGLLMSRSPSGRNERYEKMNIAGFEEFLGGLRNHVRAFMSLLTRHLVRINEGKLIGVPVWSPNPLNTKTDQFLANLKDLVSTGRLSAETLLRFHGLDSSVEVRRIASELAQDVDDIFQANVPVSYSQQVMDSPEAVDVAGANINPEPGTDQAGPGVANESPNTAPLPEDPAAAASPTPAPTGKTGPGVSDASPDAPLPESPKGRGPVTMPKGRNTVKRKIMTSPGTQTVPRKTQQPAKTPEVSGRGPDTGG